MARSQRQEVLNVILAQLLQERGVIVAPESILYTGSQRQRQMPDVIVNFQGLRTAIEGEVDAPNARDKAIASASRRVETGVAHIGIGIVYPSKLRAVEFANLKTELSHTTLQIAVVTEAGASSYEDGNVDYLERILRNTFDQLVKEDVVAEAVALLDASVERFAGAILQYKGVWGRITRALGTEAADTKLDKLTYGQQAANCRIGGLVLMNAMIFHEVLSGYFDEVTSLQDIIANKDFTQLAKEWNHILIEINYYSIFHLARQIMLSLSASVFGLSEILFDMARTAIKISEYKAALRHDLMGRVYHRLLSDAKYLGTYYTSVAAAALLLKLALSPKAWNIQWENVEEVGKFRIADLACGTGTLLMAAAEAIVDNHISMASMTGNAVELDALHKQVTEEVLHGYDVLPSAIHLTASTLALRSPNTPVKQMYLYTLPYGGKDHKLGTLDFLSGNLAQASLDLSGTEQGQAQQVTGRATQGKYITLPELDLCVMNPPFVRSVGGNLLFGSLPEDERGELRARLKKLVKDAKVQASVTSGLGSVFVAIGDKQIKQGGKIALVLPKALLSGVSWNETRQLINAKYAIDYLIVSHDAKRWNFSDSTDLSEALMIATNYGNAASTLTKKSRTVIVNLWRNPTTTLEALSVASQIQLADPPDLLTGQGASSIILNGKKAGEIVLYPWQELKKDWFLPCAFAQSDLDRCAYSLFNGVLQLPGTKSSYQISLCPLSELGVLGPDRRDIHDGFALTTSKTPYPSFWGHDAKTTFTIAQSPNQYLEPLAKAKAGRKLRRAADLWPLAGTILLAERMWLKTQRLVAIRLDERVLTNVWWSFALHDSVNRINTDKALVLWLNSTLGLINVFATRDETRGAWVDFKKPSLGAMPVLDVRALSQEQLARLAATYDSVCNVELRPLPEMEFDEVRARIDADIAQILKLPDLSTLQAMLGREPVVCMERL